MKQVCILILCLITVAYLAARFTPLLNFRFVRDYYSKTRLLKTKMVDGREPTPKLLFQTYSNKAKIPSDVYENVRRYAPEYTHFILDDSEGAEFINTHFSDEVLKVFKTLTLGAHKADLLRYCLLYINGGVYMDISTEMVKPLSSIFKDEDIMYTVLSASGDHIYQGVISTPPNNPLFLSLISYIVRTGNPLFYHDFCKDFLYQIENDINGSVKKGLNIGSKGAKYYLLNEECSLIDGSMCDNKFDKYGLCCLIYDNKVPVIKTRRESYPWV